MDLNLSSDATTTSSTANAGSFALNKYIFNSRKQEDNENIDDFAQALTRLGANVGAEEEAVVDRLIAGLKSDSARFSVLQSNTPITLDMAVSIAKTNEHGTIFYEEVDPDTVTLHPVQSIPTSGAFESYKVIINVVPGQDDQHHEILTEDGRKAYVKFNENGIQIEQETSMPPIDEKTLLGSYAKKCADLREKRVLKQCSLCSFKCLTPVLMTSHMKTFHDVANNESFSTLTIPGYECPECKGPFLTLAAMETHLVMLHGYSKNEMTKKRISQLLKPKEDFSEDKKEGGIAVCDVCFIKFEDVGELTSHMETAHQKHKFHICTHCLFRASTKTELMKHIAKEHSWGDEAKKFCCTLCNARFNTLGSLTRHTQKEHKGHKIFMCHVCGKKFQTSKTLDVHKKVVHDQVKPFQCEQCDYKAGQKASLITHINSVHENVRPYVCDACGYKTASSSTLTAHKKMVHQKQRPYVCETCGRSFAAKAGMENHILLIHEKAMPYACDHCNKRFKRKPDLNNHVRCVHQGNYFLCQLCNNTFHSQRNLDRHNAVVHEQTKPFECGVCGMSFARKERLKYHIDRTHQGDIIVETPVNVSIDQMIHVQTLQEGVPVEIKTHHILPS